MITITVILSEDSYTISWVPIDTVVEKRNVGSKILSKSKVFLNDLQT